LLLAKLHSVDYSWYALLPQTLLELVRAGRVVIPLLAVLPLIHLRRQLLAPVLLPLTMCFVGHSTLAMLVLARWGYLHPRHMLVPVMLLTPLAAMLLARVVGLLGVRRGVLVAGVCLLPLALYSLRVPNSADRFVSDAARWLRSHDPAVASGQIVSGSSGRRLAFYTAARWEFWPEQPEHYAALTRLLKCGGPGWFALEVAAGCEPDSELAGNAELLEKLLADEALAPRLGAVHRRPGPNETHELVLIELR